MIEFKLGKEYFVYNDNNEKSYRLIILSRKESDGKTIVRYVVKHYNKLHSTDIDDCEIEVGETTVRYHSDTEVLYIREYNIVILATL